MKTKETDDLKKIITLIEDAETPRLRSLYARRLRSYTIRLSDTLTMLYERSKRR